MADWEKVESPGASAEGCKASSGNLKNACDYSFADLYRAACATTSCPCDEVEVKAACESLYELKRDDLNKMVHEWAMTADWETEMQMGSDGQEYGLVFSDEFNTAGRTFANGDDAKWTALDIGDTSNQGAAFYPQVQEALETLHRRVSGLARARALTRRCSVSNASCTCW